MDSLEHWRTLLYPLGLVASIAFAVRFFIQWLSSELKKRSIVPKSFWIISYYASILMMLHSFIQIQYPVCLLQGIGGLIAWRNLDLMKPHPLSLKVTLKYFTVLIIFITLAFLAQSLFITHHFDWMRAPINSWNTEDTTIGLAWNVFGIIGMCAFASRFWIQWWFAEKRQKSELSASFWWTSMIGAFISFCYFWHLQDYVNIFGYGFGIIPYLRNLILLKNKPSSVISSINQNKIFLFAGEQSGDLHGSHLMQSLRKQFPNHQFYGVGGPKMRANGLTCMLAMEQFQVMGFSDVLKKLPSLFNHFRFIKNSLLKEPPQAIVLIDYPGFNMRLAKSLRKKGYGGKLIHYICPTVWAWKKSRIKDLAKNLDLLMAIYPFEPSYFSKTPLNTPYVGHPLVKAIRQHSYDTKWEENYNFPIDKKCISVFPGSRFHEVEANFSIQLEVIKKILENNKESYFFAVSVANDDVAQMIQNKLADYPELKEYTFLIPSFLNYELMRKSYLSLATSGTVTLELALHFIPTIVTYTITPLNYYIAKYLFRIKLPHYCIVNILGKKTIFPEFFDKELDVQKIFKNLLPLLENENARKMCIQGCQEISNMLLDKHASEEAAQEIRALVN